LPARGLHTDTYSDADHHSYSNADTNTNGYQNRDALLPSGCLHSYAFYHPHTHSYTCTHAYNHFNPHSNKDSHPIADADRYPNINSYQFRTYPTADDHANTDADQYSDSHTNPHPTLGRVAYRDYLRFVGNLRGEWQEWGLVAVFACHQPN
jgi:hypothetical protein